MDIDGIANIEVVDDETARVLRAMTGPERLRIASDIYAAVRQMLLSRLAAEHLEWDSRQVAEETARRLSLGG